MGLVSAGLWDETIMMTSLAAQSGEEDFADMRRRIRAIFIGSIGNLVEWYDFYAYAAFALYFAGAFFPSSDPVVQQLNAALLFAAGFLVRPVGGWLFGYLADHYGRRGALMLSVSLMCFGSLMIAVTPTYASIGIYAPVMLGIARIIQGLSLGGEYGTSATYLTEMADHRNRGFYSSFQYVTLIGGQICALLVLLILQKIFLTNDQIRSWGWRIPFFIGALLALIALFMRRTLHETDAFEAAKQISKKTSSLRALMRYPREVLLVVGLTAGGTAAFYTYTTYMQKFLKLSVGLTDNETTMVTLSALCFGMVLQPIYGAISDRIGRKWLLIAFGVTGVLFTIPLLTTLESARGPFAAFLLIAAAWMIVSGYTSINAVVKAELFPTNIRAIGVGLPYALTVSIFGGTTDSVALWFKSIGHERWFYYYLTGMIAVSLVVYLFMRDTKADSAMNRHE
jgi:MHS family alpha-ketoglutarate permease-like MFS transporter